MHILLQHVSLKPGEVKHSAKTKDTFIFKPFMKFKIWWAVLLTIQQNKYGYINHT